MSIIEFAITFKEAGRLAIANTRPWQEFLNPSGLSLPSSFSDATTRVPHNLTRFLSNYLLLLSFFIFFALIHHLVSILAYLILLISWLFFYFARDDPFRVFSFVFPDYLVLILLSIATALVIVFTRGFNNVLVYLAIGSAVVFLHATFSSTEDDLGIATLESSGGDYSGV